VSGVTAQIVLRFADVARGPAEPLLAPLGISPEMAPAEALTTEVDVAAYYDLLERAAGEDDDALPVRYAKALRPEDFGALGLALKTASTLREALERVARYVLVISDSLEYALAPDGEGSTFVLHQRPPTRRGARLANEAALCAVTSLLRQITEEPVRPREARFGHTAPSTTGAHEAFLGCPLRFDTASTELAFEDSTLDTPTRLADEGLSAYLLAQLDDVRAQRMDRSLETQVRRSVTDALCDGPPNRAEIARRLGMSERTLHRRLAEEGLTFRALVAGARRDVAESLLALPEHSLAEVAFLTGFSDQSAFQRAFKRWAGRTPLEFRRAAG